MMAGAPARRDPVTGVTDRTGRVHLVQAAGGPFGGDELALDRTVGEGSDMEVRAAAATVAQPGPLGAPAHWAVHATVAGTLRWWPEPTVVCAGADYRARLSVDLADGAHLVPREQAVLGWFGEEGRPWSTRCLVRLTRQSH